MMKSLRKSVSGWVAKLLLGVIVVAFIVTGFSGFFSGTPSNAVLTTGGTEVLIEDYRLAYRQAEAQLSQQIQRRPTRQEAQADGIDQRVMSQLVAEAVLDEEGRSIGLGLSEDALKRLIAEDPSFHDASGSFSRSTFRELLANVGMTENDFIRNREEAAVRLQLVEAVSEGAAAPSLVRQAFGLYNDERRTAEYVTLPLSKVQPVAEPAADVLQAYFDTHKARYRAPEYRGLSYAALTPEAISDPAAITDQQIAEDYERNAQRFTTLEKRRIEQIVYPDKAKADAAKASLAAGKLFEQLIIESGRTVADTELGTLAKSEIPDPAIADAAFALQQGEVSDVVTGAFGPVLLRVTEIQPEVRQTLDTVKEEIRKELSLAAAADAVQQAYDAFEDARASGSTMAEAGTRAGIPVKTIEAVGRSGDTPAGPVVADIPEQQAVLSGAFETEVGTENVPIQLQPNGYLFYEVTKIDPAHDRPLEEVREKLVTDWKNDEARSLLAKRVDALKARIEAGETIDQIAAAEGVTKSVAPSITRRSGVAELGEDGVRAAFSGVEGLVATADASDGGKLLLKVTQVAPPADPLASFPAGQEQRLAEMVQTDFLQAYVNLLQTRYPVSQNLAAIQAAQAMPQ